ncbi:MAG: hypothetical protein AB7W28_06845 [Armatimonadota bacterium]
MTAAQKAPADGFLLAGSASVDITPNLGVHLAGAVGLYRPARSVLDPLRARALVLDSDGRRLCFLALDVTIITADYTARIRQSLFQRFGLVPEAVMIHATQTHSAPAVGYFMVDDDFPAMPSEFEWLRGSEKVYSAYAVERAIEAVGLALEALEPVQIGAGSGIEGRFAFNRRAVKRDGTVAMPGRCWEEPAGPTWIRYLEGPIDPELGVVCLRGADGRPEALLLNYTCHPVHVFPAPDVSADWPGALANETCKACGGEAAVLVLNGACGNINPWSPFDPDYIEDHRRMGREMAATVAKVVDMLEFRDGAVLDWRVCNVRIPLRHVGADELMAARAVLDRSPQPVWSDDTHLAVDPEWTAAASVVSVHMLEQRAGALDYEVQVLRLGNTAVVGLPGEPFAELGLEIKLASPTYPTYIAHCTSHYVGYIPTPEATKRGGHEAATRYWAKLAPEAHDLIVAAAVELLQDLFR